MLLVLALALPVSGCGKMKSMSFKVVGELNSEEFRVAFRQDDPLCEIVTAAMKELCAEGHFSRLSAQYLGADYSCFPAEADALRNVDAEIVSGRKLRIGVQSGIAPLCSQREDGSFAGLIPDVAELVAAKLGWTFEYMAISSENVDAELGSGNIDCAWMAASFSGAKNSSLSPGWLKNSHEIIVRSGSNIRRKKALKGKVIGLTDSTSLDALAADELTERLGAVWYYDDLSSCFNALAAGDCDAVVIDSIVEHYYI